jgi:hypothetical protein
MRDYFSNKKSHPESDRGLHDLLHKFDPIMAPSSTSMAKLEADLLRRINTFEDKQGAHHFTLHSVNFFQQRWALQEVAAAIFCVTALGFILGQILYSPDAVPVLTSNFSIVALADTAPVQLDTFTDTTWGVNDDDTE